MNALNPPPAARRSQESIEMVRAWIVDSELMCSLNVGVFGENETITWGILLSDIARHIANALEESEGIPHERTLEAIVQSFNFEVRKTDSEANGTFIHKH